MNIESRSFEDEIDVEEGEDIEELLSELETDFSSLFINDQFNHELNTICDLARANYEKDEAGWSNFLGDLRHELENNTDDEDNLQEILQQYLKKAKLELS